MTGCCRSLARSTGTRCAARAASTSTTSASPTAMPTLPPGSPSTSSPRTIISGRWRYTCRRWTCWWCRTTGAGTCSACTSRPGWERRLAHHALTHATTLVPSLVRGARSLASVLRGPPGTHLGHQLWNELSGIEHLLASGPGPLHPGLDRAGPRQAIELWGATDLVFPELRHRVRAFASGADVLPTLHAEDICAVRVTGERVSGRPGAQAAAHRARPTQGSPQPPGRPRCRTGHRLR